MSDEYKFEFHQKFMTDLKKISLAEKERLLEIYKKVKEDPLRFKHLSGKGNCYSVRIGSLRVIYSVKEKEVLFLAIAKRSSVYEIYHKRLGIIRDELNLENDA